MKKSIFLRIIPVFFMITTVISLSTVINNITIERDLQKQQTELNKLYQQMYDLTLYLTDQAGRYVQYGEKIYLEAYYKETQITKTREKIQRSIGDFNIPDSEKEYINKSIELSFNLEKTETEAFDLVENGKLEEARSLLFNERYIHNKSPIIENLELFRNAFEQRCESGIEKTNIIIRFSLMMLFLSVLVIITVTYISIWYVNKKIKYVNKIDEVIKRLTDGDFNIDMNLYQTKTQSDSELDGITGILNTIYGIENEVSSLVKDTVTGNLSYETEHSKFKGGWAKILIDLNKAISTVREQIIENAPIAYIVIKDNVIADCNRYAYEQIGMQAGEYIDIYYKDSIERMGIQKKLKNAGILKKEKVTYKLRNGESRRFSLYVTMMESGNNNSMILWGMDIEDEERKNDIIRRNQADVQKIVDALPMAMIIENPETKEIYYANTAFYALMGFISVPEVCDINEKSLFNTEQPDNQSANEREKSIIKQLEDEEAAVIEFVYKSIRGKRIDTRVTASEIIYGGKKCVLKMIQDISEEKLRTHLLQKAADQEREANRLKSTFLANMSHEIRTPMNAIIGFTQIALMREQELHNVETFKKINSSAKNLLTIINDILDFSKIEAQKIDLVEGSFSIEDVLTSAFMIAAERIEDKKIEILLDMSPDTPLSLFGDKTRLWQILKNLLDNSAKYTEKGSIVLKVYPGERIDGRINITFSVQDTGIGMNQEQILMLFAPFSQFSDSYKYKTSGTGLGMSITKQLLELMNGTIKVDSEPDKGTCISVTIPFKSDEDVTTLSIISSKNMPKDFNILIADDDPISCEIMQRLLETAGFNVVCVHTGLEVVEEVKKKEAQGESFNVIILDYLMGEDNGIEVGRRLLQYTQNSKLLMVSAYIKKISGNQMRELGFKDVLQKPLIPSVFIKRLVDALGDNNVEIKTGYKKFTGVNVLVCEDNALNREIAIQMLNLLGIEPDVVCDGYECLRKLEEKTYDLILMDILMPEMDGKEATKRIRTGGKPYKDVCILAMTANVMIEQVEEFMNTGINGYVAKPIEFNVLHDSLAEYLPKDKQVLTNETNHDSAKATFTVDGIAVNEGLARFGGNEERYKASLLRFANDKETYKNPENKDFERFIHTLKGVAGNLGVSNLAELAKTVENEYKNSLPYKESYEALMREFEIISANINTVINDAGNVKNEEETIQETGGKEEYFSLMNMFKDVLLSGNPTECERIFKKLNNTKWTDTELMSESELISLEEAVDGYDYIKASELVEGFLMNVNV